MDGGREPHDDAARSHGDTGVASRPPPPGGAEAGRRSRTWRGLRGYGEALIIAFLVVTFVFNTVGVVGASMRPTLDGGTGPPDVVRSLLAGDRVFIPKYDTWLRRAGLLGPFPRGAIVVLREPTNAPSARATGRQGMFIKRVVAHPGDRLRIEAGTVFVNGHPLDPSFITATGEIHPDPQDFPVVVVENGRITGLVVDAVTTADGVTFFDPPWRGHYGESVPIDDEVLLEAYGSTVRALAPVPDGAPEGVPFVHELVIPDGHYFVMGDNREQAKLGSEDSRVFGPVAAIGIAGRASAVIWPPRRDGAWNWRVLDAPATFSAVPRPASRHAADPIISPQARR